MDFSSPKINAYLRSNRNNSYANLYVFEIDKLMGIFYLKEDIQVFRGIYCDISKNYVREITNLKIGDIYSDKAYLSTSLSLETASNYTIKGNGPLIIMDIKLARGTRCVPLIYKNATNNKDDFEILVRRGKKFLVKDKMITNINGREFYYFKLESIS